ncbi:MAG: hypothetical protein LIP01_11120, partial [Tannerellaceae bacterium]|nr:hypothetical protein [Tannerellaceae bacterium]
HNDYIRSGDKISISSKDLNIPLSEAYNILLLANARDYLTYYGGDDSGEWNEKFKAQGLTENDMKRLRFRLVPSYEEIDFVEGQDFTPPFPPQDVYENYDTEALIEPETLMMSGSVIKEADQDILNADLIRLVSRFDVKNTDDNYTLKTVSIWNGFRMGTIAADALTDFSLPRIIRMYGLNVDDETPNEIVGGLYAFENYVISPEQNDDQTTCLILGMENNAGKVYYYRVNVALPGRAQQLKRNNAYKLTVTRVKGVGEGSEKDAYNFSKKLIEFQINYWDQENQGNIVYDGDNILAITSSTIVFPPEGGTETMDIFTTGEGTLEIEEDATPNGITAVLENSQLIITASPSNDYKEGYIKFKFGKLQLSMTVRQSGNFEQKLDVSHSTLPVFPNTAGTVSETVTITSSGTWTAKIYNNSGNIFLFDPMDSDEITGGDNTNFQIKTNLTNNNMESRYAFVHITLDENPDISRVIILSQNGSGTIDVKLNDMNEDFDGVIYFDADGNFMEHRNNVIPDTDAILYVEIENQDISSEALWLAGFPNGPGNFSTSEEIANN